MRTKRRQIYTGAYNFFATFGTFACTNFCHNTSAEKFALFSGIFRCLAGGDIEDNYFERKILEEIPLASIIGTLRLCVLGLFVKYIHNILPPFLTTKTVYSRQPRSRDVSKGKAWTFSPIYRWEGGGGGVHRTE